MEYHDGGGSPAEEGLLKKAILLVLIAVAAATLTRVTGGTLDQVISVGVFVGIVAGTLFFWNFRLAIAFLGVAILLIFNVLDIPMFVQSASLEVILFLVGMMIVVGALRDLGFFTWVIQVIMGVKGMTGMRFVIITAAVSAFLACLVDEVTSIIFMAVLIFQVCDTLKIRPTPYLIISVMATNIGSSGTMLGNPVGIYIGTKAGLTFEDFIIWAFPVMILALAATLVVVILWYRKEIRHFEEALIVRRGKELGLGPLVDVSPWKGIGVLVGTVGFIAVHYRLEQLLGLRPNTILLMAPLVSSGIIMIAKRDRARHYVEAEVDWWTLTFFMLLFAVAGTLEYTHFTERLATGFGQRVPRQRAAPHRRRRRHLGHRVRLRGQRRLRRRVRSCRARPRRQGLPRRTALVGSPLRGVLWRQYHHDRLDRQYRRARYARKTLPRAHPFLGMVQGRPSRRRHLDRNRRDRRHLSRALHARPAAAARVHKRPPHHARARRRRTRHRPRARSAPGPALGRDG